MQLSKPILWSLFAVVMTAAGFAGVNGSYFASEFSAGTSASSDNRTLNGYWYHRQDSGCFEHGPVYSFKNNETNIIMSGEVTKGDVRFSALGTERYFFLIGEKGKEYRYFYENTGATLEVTKLEVIDGPETIVIDEQFTAYTRCEHPTTGGLIQSLFFTVFEPL